MKICVLSDTHSRHDQITLPPADVVVHCGDATATGSTEEVEAFISWFLHTPYRHRILVGGNHDWALETLADMPAGISYLRGQSIEIEGVKFYGAPWRPRPSWVTREHPPGKYSAFGVMGDEIASRWDHIPPDTQVLITHCPPWGVLDLSPPSERHPTSHHKGCSALLEAVMRVKPKLHLFGHNHHQTGQMEQEGILFVNAALMDDDYQLTKSPLVIEIPNS